MGKSCHFKLNRLHHRYFRQATQIIPAPLPSLRDNDLVVLRATSTLGGSDLEAVLETTVDDSQVGHSAAASGLPSLGLLAPVDCPKVSLNSHTVKYQSGVVHLRVLAEG